VLREVGEEEVLGRGDGGEGAFGHYYYVEESRETPVAGQG